MAEIFTTYKLFNNEEEAKELIELFEKNNIEYQTEGGSTKSAEAIAGGAGDMLKKIRIKIEEGNFEKADKLLYKLYSDQLDAIDKDYYLFEFSAEELLDVVAKQDEWSEMDYLLAQKILKDRGQAVDETSLSKMQEERIKELAKPEENQTANIIAGYFFAVVGGIIGIFIGKHLENHKKELPNGKKVFAFSENIRKQGKIIFVLSIILFVVWVVILSIGF